MSEMRYQWTTASEPPQDVRDVVVWDDHDEMWVGFFYEGRWSAYGADEELRVIYWRDVEPPT